jgi:hypothetical protein
MLQRDDHELRKDPQMLASRLLYPANYLVDAKSYPEHCSRYGRVRLTPPKAGLHTAVVLSLRFG